MHLHNRENKEVLQKKLMNEPFRRITLSFYHYAHITNPEKFRDEVYRDWSEMEVFGRTYIATEGINAQISVPEPNWERFTLWLAGHYILKDVPLKIAVEDDGKSFYKLIVRLKHKIVADGLDDSSFDVTKKGKHLTAEEWNEAMESENTLVVDMRNHYESEVGKFENAFCPDADTFAEALKIVSSELTSQKKKKVLLYCTGGIHCEKASAYLKHKGFEDVNQLFGGIIEYAHQVQKRDLPCRFRGKNFVFDDRRGERITSDIISSCHQCGKPCDRHTNCHNDACHLLFLQCPECAEKYEGCCTPECQHVIHLELEEQKKIRRGHNNSPGIYKSRLRPKLQEILSPERK